MAKRTTKADIILQAARDRLTVTEADVRSALEQLRLAEALRDEAGRVYQQLQKQLARAAAPKAPKEPKTKEKTKAGDQPPASVEGVQ